MIVFYASLLRMGKHFLCLPPKQKSLKVKSCFDVFVEWDSNLVLLRDSPQCNSTISHSLPLCKLYWTCIRCAISHEWQFYICQNIVTPQKDRVWLPPMCIWPGKIRNDWCTKECFSLTWLKCEALYLRFDENSLNLLFNTWLGSETYYITYYVITLIHAPVMVYLQVLSRFVFVKVRDCVTWDYYCFEDHKYQLNWMIPTTPALYVMVYGFCSVLCLLSIFNVVIWIFMYCICTSGMYPCLL